MAMPYAKYVVIGNDEQAGGIRKRLVLGKPTRIGDGKIADGFVESAGDGSDGGFGGKETVLMKKWDWTRDAFQLTTDLVGFHGSRPFTLRPQRCKDRAVGYSGSVARTHSHSRPKRRALNPCSGCFSSNFHKIVILSGAPHRLVA